MPGNGVRSLISISKAKGWDPTEMIAGSDTDPGAYRDQGDGLGKIGAVTDPASDLTPLKAPPITEYQPSNEAGARTVNAPIPVLSKLIGI